MLCQFTVKNFKSIRDEVTFDMQAAAISEHEDRIIKDKDEELYLPVSAVYGPNGGGKSTLAKVLMGIEKASAGQIILDGEDISNYDINHRADAGIGYAFQQPPRFKGMTVMKLLSLSAGKELKREECCKLLSTVGLCANEYIEREVDGTLSGGEMKRLEIATVLAKSHKLCIFDEPEAGIDLWSFSMLIHKFEEIHKRKVWFSFHIRRESFRWQTGSWSSKTVRSRPLEQLTRSFHNY